MPGKLVDLVGKYPEIFGNYGEANRSFVYGFECEDGWYDIIDDVCHKLMESEGDIPSATQIKEKFGSLRFYVNSSSEEQYDIIRSGESLSEVTCEVCGEPGELKTGNWLKTLCEEHATEKNMTTKFSWNEIDPFGT